MMEYGYGLWEVICPQCGEKRFLRSHKYKNGQVRGSENICHPCRAKNLQKRVSVKCPSCGDIRVLRLADSKQRLSNYCIKCFKSHSSPKYKKGRHVNITSRGYVVVLGMKNHPLANKAQQVLEHWIVFYEQHSMGKESVLWFKNRGFTIHHKNGKRDDNNLYNLELRAPGNHPHGWTIDEMREVIRHYDNQDRNCGK